MKYAKELDIEICKQCHRIYCYSYKTTEFHNRCLHYKSMSMNMVREHETKMSYHFEISDFYEKLRN